MRSIRNRISYSGVVRVWPETCQNEVFLTPPKTGNRAGSGRGAGKERASATLSDPMAPGLLKEEL